MALSRDGMVNVALAGVGTVAQALVAMASNPATAVAHPWLAPISVAFGALAGHEINRLAARVDRAQVARAANEQLLTNAHLSRVLAGAIAQRLEAFSATRADASSIRKIAARAVEWWPQLIEARVDATKAIDDRLLAQRIAERITGHASQAPTSDDWRVILETAAAFDAGLAPLSPGVLDAASEALAEHFVDDTIKALDIDLAVSGEAFGRVALTFFSEIYGDVVDIKRMLEAVLARLDTDTGDSMDTAPTRRVPIQLPRRTPAGHFVGRALLRRQLADRLRSRIDTYVYGPAGYGKTALAAEGIRDVIGDEPTHTIRDSVYPDGVVLVDLYALRSGDASEAWSHIAQSFDAPYGPGQSARDRAAKACVGKRSLVILEGAEEAGSGLGELLSVLSPEMVRLVLTCDPAQATVASHRLALYDELTPEESGSLLHGMCPDLSDDIAARIHDAFGGHPLALTWAGAAFADTTTTRRQVLAEIEAEDLPKLHDPEFESHTLKWLYQRGVRRLDDDGRGVLAAIGCLAHGAFPVAAAAAALGVVDCSGRAMNAITSLARAGFIARVTPDGEAWAFTHALAYRFAREPGLTAPAAIRLAKWAEGAISLALRQRTLGGLSTLREMLRHGDALLRSRAAADHDLERLYKFLLYDVGGRAAELGSLDVATSAIRSAEAWLHARPEPLRAEPRIARERAALSHRLGEVAIAAGDLETARHAFTTALGIVTDLAAGDPSNTQWQRDLGVSQQRLGDVAIADGDLDAARRSFEGALVIHAQLAAADPSNTLWQRDLSVTQERLGDIALAEGDGDTARDAFDISFVIRSALAASEPTNTQWQRDLGLSHNKIGDAALAAGDLAAARHAFLIARDIRIRLAAAEPANTQWQRDLSVSYNTVGDVAIADGLLEAAGAAYSAALDIRTRLAAADPTNTEWQRDLSVSYNKIGDVAAAAGDLGAARVACTTALQIRTTLAAAYPTNRLWQRDLGVSHNKLGDLALAVGDLVEARRAFTMAFELRAGLAILDATNHEWQSDLSVSYEKLGDLSMAEGHAARANESYEQALEICRRLTRLDRSNAKWRRDLGRIQRKRGAAWQAAGTLSGGPDGPFQSAAADHNARM